MNSKLNLDQVRVASPCHARWEDMAGDNRARFCGQCQKNVFNFSAMTRVEVETLLREKEGRVCGRFYQRPDGRMLTADCPSGQRRKRNRLTRFGGALFAGLMFLFGARTTLRSEETKSGQSLQRGKAFADQAKPMQPTPVLMGEIAPSPMIMGKICVPVITQTNSQPIMGDVYIPQPPATNSPERSVK